jgi:hypothetical protein
VLASAATASAADPGRWTETGRSTIPLYYYQGVSSDPARNLFFNGVDVGLYRTDANLSEKARNDDVIPPAVHASEQYNHIGDITWDEREGGRVLLPLECYYPKAAPGRPDENNTCETGSIGVADPQTLQWRYYVKLDPAEIPKVMWAEDSPDGKLLWTQSGNDLLAYSMDEIKAANAAPLGPKLKAVRRLPNAKPPSGITGGVFLGGRLYVAGQQDTTFQVWSIDLDTGERRLEIEKKVVGESEGLDVFEGLGGTLHWLIQPYNEQNVPTYGVANGTLLHFVPRGQKPTTAPAQPARVKLTITPRRIRAGRRTRLRFDATAPVAGGIQPAGGVTIRLGRQRVLTNARGVARMTVRMRREGHYFARARRADLRRGSARITVTRPRSRG